MNQQKLTFSCLLITLCCTTQLFCSQLPTIIKIKSLKQVKEKEYNPLWIRNACEAQYQNNNIPTLHELSFNKLKPVLNDNVGKEEYVEFVKTIAAHDRKNLLSTFINSCNEHKCTLLTRAARNNQPNKIKQLLDIGVDVNQLDEYGSSALHEAVRKGSATIPTMLLQAGADVNQEYLDLHPYIPEKSEKGATPLFYATSKQMIQLLLKNNANKNHTDHRGNNALHYAAERWGYKPHAITELTKAGVNINHKNNKGETPLHLAAKNRWTTSSNMIACLQAGADETIKDNLGQTPRIILQTEHFLEKNYVQEFDEAIQRRDNARLNDFTEHQSIKKPRTK